jgi:hypothetical protein
MEIKSEVEGQTKQTPTRKQRQNIGKHVPFRQKLFDWRRLDNHDAIRRGNLYT